MTLGVMLSVLSDVEMVIISYEKKDIFTGELMDISQNLPFKYWYYDVMFVMVLDDQLFIKVIEP